MNLFLKELTMEDKKEVETMVSEFDSAADEYPFEGIGNFKKY